MHQVSGTESRLRGVSVVSEQVAWASGARGTVVRTTDGGSTWQRIITLPGAENLDFRDVHAFDDRTAYILAIGAGELSRIDKTTDGGVTWMPSFRNTDPRGETWKPLQGPGFHAVDFAGPGAGWAVGEGGRMARYQGELERP
jgi:photosystem II stability/assembly factor-like uncharacterized protein